MTAAAPAGFAPAVEAARTAASTVTTAAGGASIDIAAAPPWALRKGSASASGRAAPTAGAL
eukprot:4037516-Prymnesium_polylepis.1